MAVFTGHGRNLTKTSAFAEKSSCYAHFPDEETKAHIRGLHQPKVTRLEWSALQFKALGLAPQERRPGGWGGW